MAGYMTVAVLILGVAALVALYLPFHRPPAIPMVFAEGDSYTVGSTIVSLYPCAIHDSQSGVHPPPLGNCIQGSDTNGPPQRHVL